MDLQLKKEEVILTSSLIKKEAILGKNLGKNRKRIKVQLGAGLNKYHKHISAKEKESRAKIREFYKNTYGEDSERYVEAVKNDIAALTPEKFVTNEKTLCTKVKISKKGANEKQKKIERSYQKNVGDANRTQTAMLNDIYEWYCDNVNQMNWRMFEKRMKQTKFRTETESKFKEYKGR